MNELSIPSARIQFCKFRTLPSANLNQSVHSTDRTQGLCKQKVSEPRAHYPI